MNIHKLERKYVIAGYDDGKMGFLYEDRDSGYPHLGSWGFGKTFTDVSKAVAECASAQKLIKSELKVYELVSELHEVMQCDIDEALRKSGMAKLTQEEKVALGLTIIGKKE